MLCSKTLHCRGGSGIIPHIIVLTEILTYFLKTVNATPLPHITVKISKISLKKYYKLNLNFMTLTHINSLNPNRGETPHNSWLD